MFSLRNLRFLLCSLELDVLRAQRIMGIFTLITHRSMRSEKFDHMAVTRRYKVLKSSQEDIFQETRSSFLETGWHILIGWHTLDSYKLQQEKHNKIVFFLRDFQLSLELLSAVWENVDVNEKQDNRFLSVLFFNSLFIVRKAEQTLWVFFFRDYWEI